MKIREQLTTIQKELKVGKTKFNKFGNYYYRSLEDIFDALKPLLAREYLTLTINDEIRTEGEYTFIEAIVRLENNEDFIETRAFAGIDKTKGKMDLSQIFGSASSYARKYAMNGMFLIDDSQDADTDAYTKLNKETTPKKQPTKSKEKLEALNELKTIDELKSFGEGLTPEEKKLYKTELINKHNEIK